ncbi:unnamed protein product [Caretta caretta]
MAGQKSLSFAQLRKELCKIREAVDKEKAKCKGIIVKDIWGWQIEDKVMLQKLGKVAHTLDARWMGPYLIVSHISPVVYQLQLPGKLKWVHANQLKTYASS